jgi:adenylyl cyclase-associated protein
VSTKAKKPDMGSSEYMEILKDTQEKMMAVIDLRESNRASPLKDNLAMVADSAETLGWVTLDEKPAAFVADLFGGAQMYGNKVLKQYKDK